jgi:hypothetical protein
MQCCDIAIMRVESKYNEMYNHRLWEQCWDKKSKQCEPLDQKVKTKWNVGAKLKDWNKVGANRRNNKK